MYKVSFKVKGTNRSGEYLFSSIDAAHEEESRLKTDKGLKSIKVLKIRD